MPLDDEQQLVSPIRHAKQQLQYSGHTEQLQPCQTDQQLRPTAAAVLREQLAALDAGHSGRQLRPTAAAVLREQLTALDAGLDRLVRRDLLEMSRSRTQTKEEAQRSTLGRFREEVLQYLE
jgi:hypothetical protein